MRKLTFADITDLREYERERDEFRRHIVTMKKRRRVQLGDLLMITFETTTTVHYLRFGFTPEQVDAFATGPVRIVVDHPNYDAVVELTEEQRSELVEDLRA